MMDVFHFALWWLTKDWKRGFCIGKRESFEDDFGKCWLDFIGFEVFCWMGWRM